MDTAERVKRLVRASRAWDPKIPVSIGFDEEKSIVSASVNWKTVEAATLEEAIALAEGALFDTTQADLGRLVDAEREMRVRYMAVSHILGEDV